MFPKDQISQAYPLSDYSYRKIHTCHMPSDAVSLAMVNLLEHTPSRTIFANSICSSDLRFFLFSSPFRCLSKPAMFVTFCFKESPFSQRCSFYHLTAPYLAGVFFLISTRRCTTAQTSLREAINLSVKVRANEGDLWYRDHLATAKKQRIQLERN